MPNHIPEPAIGAPYWHCCAKVSHIKAPGAIYAIAFIVRPVRPNVGFIFAPVSGVVEDKSITSQDFKERKRRPERSRPLLGEEARGNRPLASPVWLQTTVNK